MLKVKISSNAVKIKSNKSYIRERNHSALKKFPVATCGILANLYRPSLRVCFAGSFFLQPSHFFACNELCKKSKFFLKLSSNFFSEKRVLLRVEVSQFAKQLLYCILYCMVGHCFPLFIVLSVCVYCFANSVFST